MLARILLHACRTYRVLLVVPFLVLVVLQSSATAFPVCSADEVSAHDSGCPSGVGPCSITQRFEVGDGCTLDFQTRAVTVGPSAVISAALGEQVAAFTIKAGSLTVAGGGSIEARGDDAMGAFARGGMIHLIVVSNLLIDRSTSAGLIDVSGNSDAGTIRITAGASVTMNGRLAADALSNDANGGTIEISAGGAIVATGASRVSAVAGTQSVASGDIELSADGSVHLDSVIDLSGSDGGTLGIVAGAEVEIAGVQASATGDGGSGGCIDIESIRLTHVSGALLVRGGNSVDGGGCGGAVCIDANRGDVVIEGDLDADSGSPDGSGGGIDLTTRGALTVAPNVTVSAAGTLGDSCGGCIDMGATTSLQSQGRMDVSGGVLGGTIDLRSAAVMSLDGTLRADGRAAGACGGCVDIEAGREASGPTAAGKLVVDATIDAGGGACSPTTGCGSGGEAELTACDVSINSGARLLARGADGGSAKITARKSLSMKGQIDTSRTVAARAQGSAVLVYPPMALSPGNGGDVSPSPSLEATAVCMSSESKNCLLPCPTCGNGTIEFPETCDGGNVTNCDGCSAFCKTENCSDSLLCTIDLCDPQYGCYHTPAASPCVEPPTPTPTITPTQTETASPTMSATITPTPRASSTPALSPTRSETPTITQTSTISPTGTITPSVTRTSKPTVSPTPAVAGDASCDSEISAADFPALVMAIVAGENVCGADANKDGRVDTDDLQALSLGVFGER